jgi:class 3 adenylate cyclase
MPKTRTSQKQTNTPNAKISRKSITILFTDIQDSTRYWDSHGDVQGRLMVDQHNRLLIPIIEKFRGRVIKTIGDAIMASFKKPGNAVKAAIAMQQILERERQLYGRDILRVRIGIHTGRAIIERKDVFGDMVNVAARVESKAKGSEILVSSGTATKCRRKEYCLARRAKVQLKGKKSKVSIYQCHWKKSPSLIDDLQITPHQPITRRQKLEFFLHTIVGLAVIYFIYVTYIRYLLADWEFLTPLILSPVNPLNHLPTVIVAILILALVNYLVLDLKKKIPKWVLRTFKGGYGFGLMFFSAFFIFRFLPVEAQTLWHDHLFKSSHLYVRVMRDRTIVREKPALTSRVLGMVNTGRLFHLQDYQKTGRMAWNKIKYKKEVYGWIVRVVPPKIGVPKKRLTLANYFYFCWIDLYCFILGSVGFLFGYLRFRIHLT